MSGKSARKKSLPSSVETHADTFGHNRCIVGEFPLFANHSQSAEAALSFLSFLVMQEECSQQGKFAACIEYPGDHSR